MQNERDDLVPDGRVCKEFHVTSMTLLRWTNNPKMGFPPAIKIGGRNYRSRKALDEFKAQKEREGLATQLKRQEKNSPHHDVTDSKLF